jgi:hypothetical protein
VLLLCFLLQKSLLLGSVLVARFAVYCMNRTSTQLASHKMNDPFLILSRKLEKCLLYLSRALRTSRILILMASVDADRSLRDSCSAKSKSSKALRNNR